MRHGVDAELAVGHALELAVGRVVLDPLLVAPEAVAVVEHRDVPVGQPRPAIELVAGERAQAVQVRVDVTQERRGHVDVEEVRERGILPEEVEAGGIRRDQSGRRRVHGGATVARVYQTGAGRPPAGL